MSNFKNRLTQKNKSSDQPDCGILRQFLLLRQNSLTSKVKICNKEMFYSQNRLDRKIKIANEELDACEENLI